MEAISTSVVVNGMRMHWAELGEDSNPNAVPLVLLHGLNDSHLSWSRLAPLMAAAGRRVLMPDAPGCGLSERPDASYELQWQAEMIARWLETIGVDCVDVVGHSYGGGVAQMLLLEPSIQVRRLALISAGGLGPRVNFWLRLAALPGVVEWAGQPFMALGTRLAMRAARGAFPESYVEKLCAMNATVGSARAFARTVKDVISWRGQSRHFLQRAHEITRLPPTALFWGNDDPITPIEDAIEFAKTVEGVSVTSFEGGHYVHHEQAEALAPLLTEFLDAPHLRPMRLRDDRKHSAKSVAPALLGAYISAREVHARI